LDFAQPRAVGFRRRQFDRNAFGSRRVLAFSVRTRWGTGSYPTPLAAIGDVAHPEWRASVLGVYRFWRDIGYAVGALLSGIVADWLGMATAIHVVAALTLASGLFVAVFMPETLSKTLPGGIMRLDETAKF
jgi:predicted MFS family arabinose efflux permease